MSLAAAATPTADSVVSTLQETRERTLQLVEGISEADLEAVHSELMSPLVWDLGHIAAFEDLWLVHRYGGRPLLHDELMDVYDAFETPRAQRGELPFLRAREAFEYLDAVRERTLEVIAERGIGDGFTHELVIRHELQHGETMLQTLALARLPAPRVHREFGVSQTPTAGVSRDEFIEVPGGTFEMGAPEDGFAYDNERPRHHTDVRGYLIGRVPISNATFLTFVEGGGYERREWWSDEGWSWKEEYDITRPGAWTQDLQREWRVDGLHPLQDEAPVLHVSWFEADAFARAHGARLPTESEWEKAATSDHESDADPRLAMTGQVWEWTSSDFDGYPGFVAHPYREYSEVFFGQGYRVLRGSSWATAPRVASPHFRNWDYPQRRQIFAGFRIARDLT